MSQTVVSPTTHSSRSADDRHKARVAWFDQITIDDVASVGGKNASLGEMYRNLSDAGVRVPNGFATTAEAFSEFLSRNDLNQRIEGILGGWNGEDVDDLARRTREIRSLILGSDLPAELVVELIEAYRSLSRQAGIANVEVAVRSSATAEDLPEASFAGQQETFLMIHGEDEVMDAVRRCFASLYTARAVSYRRHMRIGEEEIALSAGIQRMVRSDLASSGVIFTLDTDSGFRDVVYLTGAWGFGENIVQGRVIPDGFYVHKPRLRDGFVPLVGKTVGPKELRMVYDDQANKVVNERTPAVDRERLCLADDEVLSLARWSVAIEEYYSNVRGTPTPMDIEWAKDGRTGELFIVQARPETVHSRKTAAQVMRVFRMDERGAVLATGLAIGDSITTGVARTIADPKDMNRLKEGEILVTEITDPDWEPILKRAGGLITERGGRTSHAAIIARELGIPAIVGAQGAIHAVPSGTSVTVSCAEGEAGYVYDGVLDFSVEEVDAANLPSTRTDVMVNLGDPSLAYKTAMLPSRGIGLARMEFIFASHVGVHPLALTRPEMLSPEDRVLVEQATVGYDDPTEFLVDKVALGVGTLAAAFWPRPVILRFSDFKTNEYAHLLGGEVFEPKEPNPMLGWRGASRYYHPDYRDGFELEIKAVRRVREQFGLTNLKVMIPFCRTPEEGRKVVAVMAENGLVQGVNGLEIYVMAEIPSNVLEAEEFAAIFDGFSIGSNDLTQLTLGVDRDSESVAQLFDERSAAVKRACAMVIAVARTHGRKVGICGQAPSDYPDFAEFLVQEGIDSISVTPDVIAKTVKIVAEVEGR
ncbi:MAG: phosphoenolpyruvate synthase [Acidimicrobiales bacterium]|nr:phosphoenolpyruvate synthase [Acidimicrobiales bacterium]